MASPTNETIRRRHGYPLRTLYLATRKKNTYTPPVIGSGAVIRTLAAATLDCDTTLALKATLARTLQDAVLASAPFEGTLYARVVFTETFGNPVVNVGKLEFLNGTTVIPGTPIYSTENNSMTPAASAFDADANTFWQPTIGDAEPSLGLEFATAKVIDTVRITYKSPDGLNFEAAPKSFRIEFSADGETWTSKLVVENEDAWTVNEVRSYQVAAAPPAPATLTRHARLVITETYSNQPPTIGELEFLEDATKKTGTAIFSSEGTVGTGSAKAFDSDTGNFWQPNLGEVDPYIGLTFPALTAINKVSILFKSPDALAIETAPKSFRVEVSDDGAIWTTRLTVTNEAAWTVGETRIYDLE